MSETQAKRNSGDDPIAFSRSMADIAERSQKLVTDFVLQQANDGRAVEMGDSVNIGAAFFEMTAKLMAQPTRLMEAQINLWQDYLRLWQSTTMRLLSGEHEDYVEPAADDRRFRDAAWEENVIFDYIKQSYLLTARWLQTTVSNVEGLDPKTAAKVDFYTRQFADALAPSNFVMTNPEVLRETLQTGGENLLRGLNNLLSDLERGNGELKIRMSDADAFTVGEDLATTPGKVVFQNDLMQLIQYAPVTETVHRRPLIIIPPWINKYYILDLRPKNSFVKWAVEQGITVFVISWVNPDAELARKTFDDYMLEGPVAALDAVERATGEKEANLIGYCIGGTLTAATLAYLSAKGTAKRVRSVTYFTTMVDFEESGELGVFIDEDQLRSLEERMDRDGFLDGSAMSNTFNLLRANDLVWSFVVNNYLMGKEPFPFDLLFWNSDSTRMPAAMHSFYLRKMYQENLLCKPGGLSLDNTPIDLRKIETPSCIISTREDHIAPWRSTYAATQLYSGPCKFILSGSGHIAGIVNPPTSNKYGYWTNRARPKDADKWLAGATKNEGSWWPEWEKWLSRHGGGKVPARQPGDGKLKPIEDAPGSYVKVQLK